MKSMGSLHLALGRGTNFGSRRMDWQAIIRRTVEIGDQTGFITFDQINGLIPPFAHRLEPKAIEALFDALSAHGINVTET
jgi:Sigma-70 factor, region 1.1